MNKQSQADLKTMQKLFKEEARKAKQAGEKDKAADLLRASKRLTDIIETFYRMIDAI